MIRTLRVPGFVALVLAVATAVSGPGQIAYAAPSASEVVDKVQQYYASIQHVQAQFRQEVTNDMLGQTKTSDGTMWISKPGKMRWDYVENRKGVSVVKKSFISNGSQLWVVEHDNKQIIKKSLQQDLMPVAVSFLYGKGDLKTEFTAEIDTKSKLGGANDVVLKLTPKKPSTQYKNLYLVVSQRDFHVTQSEIVDSSNNVNHFHFYAPDTAKTVAPTWFEFDEKNASKTFRIVDGDAQSGSATTPNTPAGATDLAPGPGKR